MQNTLFEPPLPRTFDAEHHDDRTLMPALSGAPARMLTVGPEESPLLLPLTWRQDALSEEAPGFAGCQTAWLSTGRVLPDAERVRFVLYMTANSYAVRTDLCAGVRVDTERTYRKTEKGALGVVWRLSQETGVAEEAGEAGAEGLRYAEEHAEQKLPLSLMHKR